MGNKWKIFISVCCCITLLTGCAMENPEDVKRKAEDNTSEKEALVVDTESDSYYELGDQIELIEPGGDKPDYVGLEYTVNSAQIYSNPSEAGIEKDSLCESAECYKGLQPEAPECIERDDAMNSKILLCDMTIKNINKQENNIDDFSLTYENDNKELVMVGFPVYFSNPKNMQSEYYNYVLLEGQSMTVQVGWIVDEDVLEVDQLDEKRLFLVQKFGSDAEHMKVIALGL